jgi:hypothetical protein
MADHGVDAPVFSIDKTSEYRPIQRLTNAEHETLSGTNMKSCWKAI